MSVFPFHVARSICTSCRNCRVITSNKGSTFLLCRQGTLPKYPRQPVAACDFYQRKTIANRTSEAPDDETPSDERQIDEST